MTSHTCRTHLLVQSEAAPANATAANTAVIKISTLRTISAAHTITVETSTSSDTKIATNGLS